MHLLRRDHTMPKPVGDVLAADAQGRAVFHQADVVNVGHLGAAHTLVNPAHHVSQNPLRVVVEFLLLFLGTPFGVGGDRNGQQVFEDLLARSSRNRLFFHFFLHTRHRHLVIVHGMQGGRRRAGYPSGVGARQGMSDFQAEHVGHQIRHGPHALANLRATGKAAGQTNLHVVLFIRSNPGGVFHVAFADHRASQHGRVDFVTGAIKETGVDERHTAFRRLDARLQVHRRAPLLIHDAELHGAVRQAEHFLHAPKQLAGKGHFGRAVHFGLDDVDTALARVAQTRLPQTLDVVHGNGRGDHRIHDAFRNFLALLAPQDGRIGHEVSHIAHEQQRTSVQNNLAPARRLGVDAVGIEPARQRLSIFFK